MPIFNYDGGVILPESDNVDIPVASAAIHVVTPSIDGGFGNLRVNLPDRILPFAISCAVVNNSPDKTINLRASPGQPVVFSLPPSGVVEVLLVGETGGVPEFLVAPVSSLGAGRAFLRGLRDVDPENDIPEPPEPRTCAVYRLLDCQGAQPTLYTTDNLNVYVGRIVCVPDETDDGFTCYRVDRVPFDDQTMTSPIEVDRVFVDCGAAVDSLSVPYNAELCQLEVCAAGAVVNCDQTDPSDCNCASEIFFNGEYRDWAYFQTVFGAGEFVRYSGRITVESCEGFPSTCRQCCWCFENGQFCDQVRSEFGCTVECCINYAGVCTCAA